MYKEKMNSYIFMTLFFIGKSFLMKKKTQTSA